MKAPSTADRLRQTADLYERLAKVPTSGGHRADQVLHALAEKLYSEAAAAERAPLATQRKQSK